MRKLIILKRVRGLLTKAFLPTRATIILAKITVDLSRTFVKRWIVKSDKSYLTISCFDFLDNAYL